MSYNEHLTRRTFIARTGTLAAGLSLAALPGITSCQSPAKEAGGVNRIMLPYIWRLASSPGGNIGDYSITPGMVALFKKHFPERRITAITTSKSDENVRFTIENTLHRFPECDVVSDIFGASYRTVRQAMEQANGGSMPDVHEGNIDVVFDQVASAVVAEIRENHPGFASVLAETSLVTFTSGMILVYGKGTLAGTNFWGYTIPMSLPLLVAWKLGIPYGAYAHSFDSFGDAGGPGRPYFKKLLEGAKFVFCRDGDSVKYIESLGIQAPHLMFVPDGTVSFELRDDDWADKLMQRNNLVSKDFLVIIPRTYLGGGQISPTIGETRSLAHMAKIRSVIQQWVARTGKKVLIGAEVFRDSPNAKTLVYDLLPEDTRKQCVMLDEFWTTEQAVSVYRHARVILSMELHSFLLGIPQGIPTVVPTFKESGRKISMLNDFKVPDWYFDIDEASAEAIADTIDGIHRNYEQATERLTNDVIPHIRQLEQQAMDIMAAASRRV